MQKAQDTPTYELLRAQRGKAVQILYERYGRKLYSYALSSWHLDEDTAWDIVQDRRENRQLRIQLGEKIWQFSVHDLLQQPPSALPRQQEAGREAQFQHIQ